MVSVDATPTVLSWPKEKEECNAGQVVDGFLAVRSSLADGVKSLEDRDGDGADSCRRRVLFCVGRKLSAQAKVKFSQLVVSGVAGPQG